MNHTKLSCGIPFLLITRASSDCPEAFGESLDSDRLERYEVHLDRKLERMLILLR